MKESNTVQLSKNEFLVQYKQFFQPDALKASLHIKAEDGNLYLPVLVEEAEYRYNTEEYPYSYYVKIDMAKGARPSVGTSGGPSYSFSFDMNNKDSVYQYNIFKYTSRFYYEGMLYEVTDWLDDKIIDDQYQYYLVNAKIIAK